MSLGRRERTYRVNLDDEGHSNSISKIAARGGSSSVRLSLLGRKKLAMSPSLSDLFPFLVLLVRCFVLKGKGDILTAECLGGSMGGGSVVSAAVTLPPPQPDNPLGLTPPIIVAYLNIEPPKPVSS